MEYFAGLDVSMEETHVCVVDLDGAVVHEVKAVSSAVAIAAALAQAPLCTRVVFETGRMAPMLFHGLAEHGIPVICIESRQAYQALKTLTTHKTDRNDARGLAQRLCRKLLHEIGCGMMAAPHCGSRSMFKGRHFDRSVILLCVRWYLAYSLSLRDLEEMLTERGVSVDHSTIHRWVEHFSPRLLERFNRRKRAVTGKWHVDETYIKVRGRWMYQYRAIDSVGDTVEFWFSEHRDLPAAKRFLRKALARHGRPDRIVIDGSQTNREAIIACDTESRLLDRPRRPLKRIGIRQSQYLNNRIEQDHRRIKRRARPMLGFKSFGSAAITLAGIEMVQMMRKRQGRFAFNPAPTLKEQFEAIAA